MGVNFGNFIADCALFGKPLRTAQFVSRFAQNIDQVLRAFGVHGHGFAHIGNLADHGVQKCRRHGNFRSADGVVVFHAVLAGDARHPVNGGDVENGHIGAHKLRELIVSVGRFFRLHRIAPAEIVESRQMIGIHTHGHGVSHRFVNRAGRHPVGVDIAVTRADAVGDHHAFHRIQKRPDDRRIRRPVIADADQGLDHRAALDFMIVLAHHRFF